MARVAPNRRSRRVRGAPGNRPFNSICSQRAAMPMAMGRSDSVAAAVADPTATTGSPAGASRCCRRAIKTPISTPVRDCCQPVTNTRRWLSASIQSSRPSWISSPATTSPQARSASVAEDVVFSMTSPPSRPGSDSGAAATDSAAGLVTHSTSGATRRTRPISICLRKSGLRATDTSSRFNATR